MQDEVFKEPFLVSAVTFSELEDIKTSGKKDEETKSSARNLLRLFSQKENLDKYVIVPTTDSDRMWCELQSIIANHDGLILAGAYRVKPDDGSAPVFVTEDLSCRALARSIGIQTAVVENEEEEYKGYIEVALNDQDLADFYSTPQNNFLGLLRNQYVILQDEDGRNIDCAKWDGNQYKRLASKPFKSRAFGVVKSLDEYQRCAFDALISQEVIALCGKPGTGKTTLPLAYLMQMVETQQIRQVHIIAHFEPLRGSRQLGFMKGDRTAKQLTTGSLGNILESKFGDATAVDGLIATGAIRVVSASDLRGVEFGADDAVYVTEAQDMDAYTIRTIIERCKSGCKQIYEGDIRQIDILRRSGFPKLIDVFKGDESFACVKLKKDYRSRLGALADQIV